MKNILTQRQVTTINGSSNIYLKMLYITDFLFNKEKTKEGLCAVYRESNKTDNINIKKFYLYLTCKFNLRHRLPILDNTIIECSLNNCEEKEMETLNFIDIYGYKLKEDEELDNNGKIKKGKELIKRYFRGGTNNDKY